MPNMPNMDMRGAIRGTVRGANKAPVADTAVTAVERGQRRAVRGDDRCAGRLRLRCAAGRRLQRHGRLGRPDRVPAAGCAGRRRPERAARHHARCGLGGAGSRCRAAGAAAAGRRAQTARHRPRNEHRALGSGNAGADASRCSSTRTASEHDTQVPGSKPAVTYRRERVYRRQTINEKIEEALADAEEHSVKIGVDAAITTQFAHRTKGEDEALIDNHAYALASADLFFTAGIAQNTVFFADIVALSGSPPDAEIPALTLLNGYTARLGRPERTQPARSVAAHRALRPAPGADHGAPRPDQLLRRQRALQRREHAVPQRRARQQPDARPVEQRHRRGRGVRSQERLPA